jgi:YVTN family beta-propeller protein
MKKRLSQISAGLLFGSLFLVITPQIALAAETLDYTYNVTSAQDAVISPDGSSLWVLGGANIYQYSTSTHSLLNTVALSGVAQHLVMSPDGTKIYAAFYAATGVAVVNTSTATRTSVITTLANPWGIAISPDGAYVYVAEAGGNLQKISTSNDTVVTSVVLSGALRDIETSPDGTLLYVCNYGGGSLVKVNASDLSVNSSLSMTPPTFVSISPDGSIAYVGLYVTSSANLLKVSTANMTLTTTITGFSSAGDASFSSDGLYLYVSNSTSNTVSKLRLSDNVIVSTISGLTGTTWHVAIEPSGNFLYIMSTGGYVYVYNLGNPPKLTLSIPASATFRTNVTISANFSTGSGLVTFYANGKYIPNCKKIATSGGIASCTFKPSSHGQVVVSAAATGGSGSASARANLPVFIRATKR